MQNYPYKAQKAEGQTLLTHWKLSNQNGLKGRTTVKVGSDKCDY